MLKITDDNHIKINQGNLLVSQSKYTWTIQKDVNLLIFSLILLKKITVSNYLSHSIQIPIKSRTSQAPKNIFYVSLFQPNSTQFLPFLFHFITITIWIEEENIDLCLWSYDEKKSMSIQLKKKTIYYYS